MSCAHPIYIKNKSQFKHTDEKFLRVPCGHCLACRMVRQTQLTFLATQDLIDIYKHKGSATFITLTYSEHHIKHRVKFGSYASTVATFDELATLEQTLPVTEHYYTLHKPDLQKFMKRLRINMERDFLRQGLVPPKLKYIAAGEYGDSASIPRPHYHLVLLGLPLEAVKRYVKDAWSLGIIDCGVLQPGGLRYVLKYCTKSNPDTEVKRLYEECDVQKPFVCHSIGLGRNYVLSHLKDIIANPYMPIAGQMIPYPKYVLQMIKRLTGYDLSQQVYRDCVYKLKPKCDKLKTTVEDYMQEQAWLREQQIVDALKSRGMAVSLKNRSRVYKPRNSGKNIEGLQRYLAYCMKHDKFPEWFPASMKQEWQLACANYELK